MSRFEASRWADAQFGQDYRDYAEIYPPYRSNFFKGVAPPGDSRWRPGVE